MSIFYIRLENELKSPQECLQRLASWHHGIASYLTEICHSAVDCNAEIYEQYNNILDPFTVALQAFLYCVANDRVAAVPSRRLPFQSDRVGGGVHSLWLSWLLRNIFQISPTILSTLHYQMPQLMGNVL